MYEIRNYPIQRGDGPVNIAFPVTINGQPATLEQVTASSVGRFQLLAAIRPGPDSARVIHPSAALREVDGHCYAVLTLQPSVTEQLRSGYVGDIRLVSNGTPEPRVVTIGQITFSATDPIAYPLPQEV